MNTLGPKFGGPDDGGLVGFTVGDAVGDNVGFAVGATVGATVGVGLGEAVCTGLAVAVGADVGEELGAIVGCVVGIADALDVGAAEAPELGVVPGSGVRPVPVQPASTRVTARKRRSSLACFTTFPSFNGTPNGKNALHASWHGAFSIKLRNLSRLQLLRSVKN